MKASDFPGKTWTKEKLMKLNMSRNYGKEGCYWPDYNTEEMKRHKGLERVYTGGDTGTLMGYRAVK